MPAAYEWQCHALAIPRRSTLSYSMVVVLGFGWNRTLFVVPLQPHWRKAARLAQVVSTPPTRTEGEWMIFEWKFREVLNFTYRNEGFSLNNKLRDSHKVLANLQSVILTAVNGDILFSSNHFAQILSRFKSREIASIGFKKLFKDEKPFPSRISGNWTALGEHRWSISWMNLHSD